MIALLFASSLLACRSQTAPNEQLNIATDRSTYALTGSGVEIRITVTNHSESAIWLSKCSSILVPIVETRTGNRWSDATNSSCGSAAREPHELLPGSSAQMAYQAQTTGVFRVRAPVFRSTTSVAPSNHASPEFEVR